MLLYNSNKINMQIEYDMLDVLKGNLLKYTGPVDLLVWETSMDWYIIVSFYKFYSDDTNPCFYTKYSILISMTNDWMKQ